MLTRFCLSICAGLIALGPLVCQAEALKSVEFHPVDRHLALYRAKVGTYVLELENPNAPLFNRLWDSPLYIRQGKRLVSKSDELLVTRVFYIEKSGTLIIESNSGSETLVDFLDIRTGKRKAKTLTLYTEGLRYETDRITVRPGCECVDDNPAAKDAQPCGCSAAHVYRLDAQSLPHEAVNASHAMTQRIVGVTFTGNRQVCYPKTPAARLMPEGWEQESLNLAHPFKCND